jgi:trk system potassium uptake protein TrkA
MKVLVIGCGRVGSRLAMLYDGEGHEVNVIDEQREAADNLGPGFGGIFFRGVGLDIDVLKRAGIEACDICVVATDGDNTNLVVAQIAHEQFNVPCVVVRVFDPNRADFYAGRGYSVICPVKLTVEAMHRVICESSGEASA